MFRLLSHLDLHLTTEVIERAYLLHWALAIDALLAFTIAVLVTLAVVTLAGEEA